MFYINSVTGLPAGEVGVGRPEQGALPQTQAWGLCVSSAFPLNPFSTHFVV